MHHVSCLISKTKNTQGRVKVDLGLTMDQDKCTSGTSSFSPFWHFIPFLFVDFYPRDSFKSRSVTFRIFYESTRYSSYLMGTRQEWLIIRTTSILTRHTKHPFAGVQSSRAIQAPTALGGSVYKNVESLWQGTEISPSSRSTVWDYSPTPPILGCLQMIILCNTLALLKYPRSWATSRIRPSSNVYFLNTGSSWARAWPILLIDSEGGTRSLGGPFEPGSGVERELGSRKYRIYNQILTSVNYRGLTLSFELMK
jgi:hypothetical protein